MEQPLNLLLPYGTVLHSKSVVVRLSDSDQLQLEGTNAVEQGLIKVQIIRFKKNCIWMHTD